MVPESTPVCFRCKMCKKCFTTMSDINCHLKATNHYIRNSPNNNNNNNHSSSTKDKSVNVTSTNNNKSLPSPILEGEDKPLNLSSKPIYTPSRGLPSDKIDLTVSSKSISVEGKQQQQNGKDKVKVKPDTGKEEGPKAVSSRKSSREDPPAASSTAVNATTATETTSVKHCEDTAEIETDTVSSTSSETPPPPNCSKLVKCPVTVVTPVDSNEAESTQFVDVEGDGSFEEPCTTTTQSPGEKVELEETKSKCDDNQDMEIPPQDNTLDVPLSEMATQVVSMEVDKETQSPGGQSSENENKEPVPLKKQTDKRQEKKGKKKYRCKHCAEKFKFPVQVLLHMRKVHWSSAEGPGEANNNNNNSKPLRRRSSANSPSNNNNNDTTKVNVQTYPLRSHYARAKRRTRSMVSDSGAPAADIATRRSSLGQKVSQVNTLIKKKSTTTSLAGVRKAINFTCKHCGKKFPLLNHLKIHLHKVHPKAVKKNVASVTHIGQGTRKRKLAAVQRLASGVSKRLRRTTTGSFPTPEQIQPESRSLRVSTRSVSKSVESEGESGRMSTRRSSVAKSDKSGTVASSSRASSRRSSTRKELALRKEEVDQDMAGVEEEQEQPVDIEEKTEEMSESNVEAGVDENAEEKMEADGEEEEDEDTEVTESNNNKGEEEEYNDEDCMIIDTVESILYALTSKRSQTCPNCNKYCKFAGNFRLHLKACLNLDDDMEMREGEGSFRVPVGFKSEQVADDDAVEEDDEDDQETDPEGDDGIPEHLLPNQGDSSDAEAEEDTQETLSSPSVPYYQRLEYRRCWECGFVVSKFHNLSRHLKQRHNIIMGTKEMHAKQSEVLRLQNIILS